MSTNHFQINAESGVFACLTPIDASYEKGFDVDADVCEFCADVANYRQKKRNLPLWRDPLASPDKFVDDDWLVTA